VKIKIYTVAGRLIKETDQRDISDKFVSINWNGKDEDGETLGNGVYIYKLIVESFEGTSVTNVGKLAVLK
jgi:flagellar hook assembly protein FlgD